MNTWIIHQWMEHDGTVFSKSSDFFAAMRQTSIFQAQGEREFFLSQRRKRYPWIPRMHKLSWLLLNSMVEPTCFFMEKSYEKNQRFHHVTTGPKNVRLFFNRTAWGSIFRWHISWLMEKDTWLLIHRESSIQKGLANDRTHVALHNLWSLNLIKQYHKQLHYTHYYKKTPNKTQVIKQETPFFNLDNLVYPWFSIIIKMISHHYHYTKIMIMVIYHPAASCPELLLDSKRRFVQLLCSSSPRRSHLMTDPALSLCFFFFPRQTLEK